jgi:hypothetical protein
MAAPLRPFHSFVARVIAIPTTNVPVLSGALCDLDTSRFPDAVAVGKWGRITATTPTTGRRSIPGVVSGGLP